MKTIRHRDITQNLGLQGFGSFELALIPDKREETHLDAVSVVFIRVEQRREQERFNRQSLAVERGPVTYVRDGVPLASQIPNRRVRVT